MLKKLATVGLLGAVGAVPFVAIGGWSYVKTCMMTASDTVRDSVPIEWEIKRARQMIEDLQPEIAKNLRVVAQEENAVEDLAAEIKDKETLLADSRSKIMRLKGDLESGSTRFVYAGRNFTEQQVKDDLASRFKQFQVHEQTVSKLSQILAAREKNLSAARQKLDEMLSAKRELEIEIENLQARLTMVEVAQTSSRVALDDSQLSSTKQLLDDIRTRIDVSERMVASEGVLTGNIPLDESSSDDLLGEIADYFGEGRTEVETLVSTDSQ